MNAARVSVLIPCLDDAAALEDALDLAFAQNECDFEILVLDRGSTQPRMAASISDLRWPRTRCLILPGYSRAAALERGLSEAVGEFVVVFGASASLSANFLAVSLQTFDQDPKLGLLTAATEPGTQLGRREWIRVAGGFEVEGNESDPGLRRRMQTEGHRVVVMPDPEPRRPLPEIHALLGSPAESDPVAAAPFGSSTGASGSSAPQPGTDFEPLTRLATLEAALESARVDARGLRASLSWRVTAPLRALHRWLTRSRDHD